jgi:hypothetical protein
MAVRRLIVACVLAGVLGLALGQAAPTAAQAAPLFTLNAASAYLRDIPSPQGERTYSIFSSRAYRVTGRNADSTWLRLDFAGATRGTWIQANYGRLDGEISTVPVVAAASTGVTLPASAPTSAAPGPTSFPVITDSAGPVRGKLTITVASTYVRSAPDWGGTRIASIFKNAVLDVTGRDGPGNWLQIVYGGAAWVPAGVGTYSGSLMALPIAGGAPPPTPAPGQAQPPPELPAWIPLLTPRQRNLYALAGLRGRNMRAFAIAGDCNSESYLYSDLIGNGWYGYENNQYLHPTWLYFGRSMKRPMLAVNGGFTSASVMDPLWADPTWCEAGESPFACELRVSNASVIFIMLGTGDHFQWQSFETNYRRLLDHAIASNVLPVLVTKADALESEEGGAEPDYINNVVRRLAAEYDLPLFDFHQAVQSLPNRGLTDEPGHDFHLNAEAIGVHVLGTMQMLYNIRYR